MIINLIPRRDPLVYKPPQFGDLSGVDLKLELLEDKTKVKTSMVDEVYKTWMTKNRDAKKVSFVKESHPPTKTFEDLTNESLDPQINDFDFQEDDILNAFGDDEYLDLKKQHNENLEESSGEDEEYDGEDILSEEEEEVVEEVKDTRTKKEKLIDDVIELRDYKKKFELLQIKYGEENVDVPNFENNPDVDYIKKHYKSVVQEKFADKKSEKFRNIIIFIFIGIEYMGTKIGMNLTGFANVQMNAMIKYRLLLIELGEKYVEDDESMFSEWPVEARLAGLIFFNTMGFWLIRRFGDGVFKHPAIKHICLYFGLNVDQIEQEATTNPYKGPRNYNNQNEGQ